MDLVIFTEEILNRKLQFLFSAKFEDDPQEFSFLNMALHDPFNSVDQTYLKRLAIFSLADFLKYVWPFFNIFHERVS